MGIRFTCPNGHKLHVKAFLAGKRGICPDCDVKFIVPVASGGSTQPIAESTLDNDTRGTPTGHAPAEKPAAIPDPPPAAAPAELPGGRVGQSADMWYVRPVAGNQYGPATTETLRGWAAEGRVPPDSWVWCTAWPAWKTGDEAISLLSASVGFEPPVLEPPKAAAILPSGASVTKRHQSLQRMRRDRARLLTIALGGLVLLLLIAVVLVVARG